MRFFFEHIRLLARFTFFLGVNHMNDHTGLLGLNSGMAQGPFMDRVQRSPDGAESDEA
jgi:hypothetical protein